MVKLWHYKRGLNLYFKFSLWLHWNTNKKPYKKVKMRGLKMVEISKNNLLEIIKKVEIEKGSLYITFSDNKKVLIEV